MESSEKTPAPVARTRLDRLFVNWLSHKSTQDYLVRELKRVLAKDDSGVVTSSRQQTSSPSRDDARSTSPSTPPVGLSPRSSRRSRNNSLTAKSTRKLSSAKSKDAKAKVTVSPPLPSLEIPPFYFPFGKPTGENRLGLLKDVHKTFKSFPKGAASLEDFSAVVKMCGLPYYWRTPLFLRCSGNRSTVTYPEFKQFWTKMSIQHHDEAAKFVCILGDQGAETKYLVPDDFVDLIQDVVDTHPGLTFLSSTPEFHARYIDTVIERIFYTVCHNWHYQMSMHDIRKSKLLQAIKDLENEPDINQELNFFSYEHFYVLYCKFWELDTDHDLVIDAKDLSAHDDHVMCPKVIDRLLSGIVTSKESASNSTMSYREFVWFLLSEEDKTTWRSIEYWFRVLDVDGDGYLSLYEMEYFYSEMLEKMEQLGIEGLPVLDSMCQIIDMINPQGNAFITLKELKHSKLSSVFFNTFVNIDKYLDYEQRDPVASSKTQNLSDWDKYAAEQYELLISEEELEESDEDLPLEDQKALSLA